jgi:hypothetical protein
VVGFSAFALIVLTVGTVVAHARQRSSGEPVRVRSDEGGISVAAPRGWTVVTNHPSDRDNQEFLSGHENAAFGFLQRGGFWVARTPAAEDMTLATIKVRRESEQVKSPKENWSVREESVAGFDAVTERYSVEPDLLQRIRLGDKRIVIREFIARGFVYQIGTWTLPRAGDVTKRLEALANSIELFTPRAWTADVEKTARLRLPGGWVQTAVEIPSVVFSATAPGDPVYAWVYVFHYPDVAVSASVATARKNISDHKGTITDQRDAHVHRRDATRVDFMFPDGAAPDARNVEWIVSDGHGGTYVLAVGRRSGDDAIAERILAGWRWQ